MIDTKNTVWQIRLNKDLKEEFFAICNEKALNTSEVVRRLMARWIEEQTSGASER